MSATDTGIQGLRTLIQNEIMKDLMDGDYREVFYSKPGNNLDHASMQGPPVDPETQGVRPKSAKCNEQSASFAIDTLDGKKRKSDRTSWVFQVNLDFSKEVTAELVEEDLRSNGWNVDARDQGFPYVFLDLLTANYEHPVFYDSQRGTRITYTIQATTSRS